MQVSIRQNGTKINRVVSFRGFVPDTEGEPKDRLYFVADARTDKAEEAAMDTEAGEDAGMPVMARMMVMLVMIVMEMDGDDGDGDDDDDDDEWS
eukprot:2224690-Rhodomonas_salina.4